MDQLYHGNGYEANSAWIEIEVKVEVVLSSKERLEFDKKDEVLFYFSWMENELKISFSLCVCNIFSFKSTFVHFSQDICVQALLAGLGAQAAQQQAQRQPQKQIITIRQGMITCNMRRIKHHQKSSALPIWWSRWRKHTSLVRMHSSSCSQDPQHTRHSHLSSLPRPRTPPPTPGTTSSSSSSS